jgi:hypothetical protein
MEYTTAKKNLKIDYSLKLPLTSEISLSTSEIM